MCSLRAKDIKKFPPNIRKQIEDKLNEDTAIGNQSARIHATEQECSKQQALGMAQKPAESLVNLDCPVLIRITRVAPRSYDYDNFVGGCKELVDAICASIGKQGDSEEDGVKVEYVQEKGEYATRVEIFQDESNV